jgi:hypothetical protein
MRIKSGKKAGKTTEELLIKEPDWVQSFLRNVREGNVSDDFRRLVDQFNEKPFTRKCDGQCGRNATRATGYEGGDLLYFWCNECNPYSSGARTGALHEIRTLGELLQHVDWTANGNRAFKRRMTRTMAEAKGLKKKVGEKEALDFFS